MHQLTQNVHANGTVFMLRKAIFYSIACLCFITQTFYAQGVADTSKHCWYPNKVKNCYGYFYMNDRFKLCTKKEARYYGYSYYDENGKKKTWPVQLGEKNHHISYTPHSSNSDTVRPELINGTLVLFKNADTLVSEVFTSGLLNRETYYDPSPRFLVPEKEVAYLDSLYNNSPGSWLVYSYDNNIAWRKTYYNLDKKLETQYLVKVTETFHKDRLLAGLQFSAGRAATDSDTPGNFLELGISRKFIHTIFVDTTGLLFQEKWNEQHYLSANATLLIGNSNNRFCLGQKVTGSFLFIVNRVEAGFVNYTDFKKDDLRFLFGFGFSVKQYFNLGFSYSLPLAGQRIPGISPFSINLFYN